MTAAAGGDELLVVGGAGAGGSGAHPGSGDGDVRVEVVPGVGARLHRIRAFGHDVLRTPPDVAEHRRHPFLWGAFVMVPWCNRVPDGRIEFGSAAVAVPTNQVDDGAPSAIHGLAFDRPWAVGTDGTLTFRGGDELPWPWSAIQRTTVAGATVTVTLAVRNEGTDPMPAGVGLHPWFSAAGGLRLRLAAERVYRRRGMIPVGDPVPVDPELDLRSPRLPPWGMDDAFTDLGRPFAELAWPDWGLSCVIEASPAVSHGVVAAVEDMAAVAVEAQTEATDAYRRLRDGEVGGAKVLVAGEELAMTVNLHFRVR
jgi:aldose 1-epimerase